MQMSCTRRRRRHFTPTYLSPFISVLFIIYYHYYNQRRRTAASKKLKNDFGEKKRDLLRTRGSGGGRDCEGAILLVGHIQRCHDPKNESDRPYGPLVFSLARL